MQPLSKQAAEYFYSLPSTSPITDEFERGFDMMDIRVDSDACMMMPELGGFDWVTIWRNQDGSLSGIRAVDAPGDPMALEH